MLGNYPNTGTMELMTKIKLDPEFQRLIPDPTPEEYAGLKKLIEDDGFIRDPLKVWKGHSILVDGYTRMKIAKELGIDIPDSIIQEIEFIDRTDALLWILDNQLGRRNINSLQRTSLQAQILKLRDEDTASAAKALGVSRRTVQRDKTVARAAEILPQEIKDRITKGNLAATKEDLKRFAGLDDKQQKQIIETLVKHPEKHFNDAMPPKPSRLVLEPEDMEFVKTCVNFSDVTRARIKSGHVRVTKASLDEFRRLAQGKQQLVDDLIVANEEINDLSDAIQTAKRSFPSKTTAPKESKDINSRIDKQITDLIKMFDELCASYKDQSLPFRDDCVAGMKAVRARWNQWTGSYK